MDSAKLNKTSQSEFYSVKKLSKKFNTVSRCNSVKPEGKVKTQKHWIKQLQFQLCFNFLG